MLQWGKNKGKISERCYIVMDNVGGHGTDATIEQYKKMGLDDFNIELIHQVPRSPVHQSVGSWRLVQLAINCREDAVPEENRCRYSCFFRLRGLEYIFYCYRTRFCYWKGVK